MRRFKVLFDRVIFMYFIVGIVPLLLILSLFLQLSTDQFSSRTKETFALQAQNYTAIANTEIDHLLQQVYAIAVDRELTSIFRQFDRNQNRPYVSTLLRARGSFFRSLNSDLSDFIYIDEDGNHMLSQRSADSLQSTRWEDADYRKETARGIIDSNSILFLTVDSTAERQRTGIRFYIGFPVSHNLKKTPTGALLIGINDRFFGNMPDSLQNADLNQAMHNLIVDENDHILFCENAALCGAPLETYLASYGISDSLYTHTEHALTRSPWRHISYLPHTMEYNSLISFRQNSYFMMVVLCALVFLLVSSVVVMQNLRIRRIAQDIVHFSGAERDYKIKSHSNTVLQEIIVEFNAMTERVQSLVEQLRQKEQAIADSLNRRRIAEIKTMEAQINPHFLYNTLDTISWTAIEKGEYEISDMICSIAHLLQYSIRSVDQPVYVREEVAWLKNYMYLQERRFVNLFQYRITVKDNLDDCMIYKLLLQPIVENSILHAFHGASPDNRIAISIEPDLCLGRLRITVSDNGCGMPPAVLERVLHYSETDAVMADEHIGLFSAISRVRAYYGDAASIDIHSSGRGTQTVLSLPMLYAEEEGLK